ncbi:unnamed protein product, partial [Ectocarpus sp. 4 AP-2014]
MQEAFDNTNLCTRVEIRKENVYYTRYQSRSTFGIDPLTRNTLNAMSFGVKSTTIGIPIGRGCYEANHPTTLGVMKRMSAIKLSLTRTVTVANYPDENLVSDPLALSRPSLTALSVFPGRSRCWPSENQI